MMIIDGHLDLAMNAFRYNRNILRPIAEIRQDERRYSEKGRASNTVALPDMRQARVAICFATVLARLAQVAGDESGYNGQEICHAMALGQLAYYELLERQGHLRILRSWPEVDQHIRGWQTAAPGAEPPLGIVISMEGCDPITTPDEVPFWQQRGLRSASLAHYGLGAYAHGTSTEGSLLPGGRPLLHAFQQAGIILDVVHLADQAFWEAMEAYDGPVMASHGNCRALVPNQRQLSDEQLRAIVARDGVIGVALDMWMLQPGWIHRIAFNEKRVTLAAVADHIDHICQLAGNAAHAAIGSDLDGGYGAEQTPLGFDTIGDLQQLPDLLSARGYTSADIAQIMHGNWLRLLRASM